MLDGQGMPVPTFDNKDIIATARGWTGLERQASRTNFEATTHYYDWATNDIDPMRILTKVRRRIAIKFVEMYHLISFAYPE